MGVRGAGMLLRKKARRVAVLGAGPSGLLAAQAAYERGYDPVIFSRPPLGDRNGDVAKSELHGCQYLHAPSPPSLLAGVPGVSVVYTMRGSAGDYRRKVYGTDDTRIAVSPDEYGNQQGHFAWDLRRVYDELWKRWLPHMKAMTITPDEVSLALEKDSWAKVLVTVPAPSLCKDPTHRFTSQAVWAMGQRDGTTDFPFQCPEFTVICNGDRDTGWYRIANVFGMRTVEWPMERKPPIAGVVRVEKPLETDCKCHLDDDKIVRLGRFGKWQKGVLVHTAYEETKRLLP